MHLPGGARLAPLEGCASMAAIPYSYTPEADNTVMAGAGTGKI
jgi:hypothetical protein